MKHNDELRKEYEDLTDSSAYSNKEKQQLHYGYTLWLEDKIGQTLPIDGVSKSFNAKDFEYSEFIKGNGREYNYVSNKIHYFVNGELVKILNQ